MAMLKRNRFKGPARTFSTRLPEYKCHVIEDFAIDKRLTVTAAVAHLIDKGLEAEGLLISLD